MSRIRNSEVPVIAAAKGGGRSKFWSTLTMLAGTAVMLALVFPPFYCFFLAPVALVPLSICALRRPLTWRYLLAYFLAGLGFFLPNLFWLAPVTGGGWAALSCLVALYVMAYAAGMRRLVVELRLPATLVVPVVWTALEYIRSTFLLGGFPWFMLGNCLTPVPALIQAADLFGVWGLTFLLAMMNGLAVDILRLPLYQKSVDGGNGKKGAKSGMRFSPVMGRLIAVVGVLTAGWITYGVFRLMETVTRPGPRVAVIQENIPQTIKEGELDQTLMRYFRQSEAAMAAEPKADMVVWPETMITASVNPELVDPVSRKIENAEELNNVLGMLAARKQEAKNEAAKITNLKAREEAEAMADARWYWSRLPYVFKALNDQVQGRRIPLLLGYSAYVPSTAERPSVLQNRTLLLVPGTTEAIRAGEYSKRHLVPFGEYLPFRGVPLLSRIMPLMSPINYKNSNTPGAEWTRFKLAISSRNVDVAGTQINSSTRFYEFGTPICFEDVMPEPAREMTRAHGRKADFLVNMSNDGWFYWVELDQHLQACQLRAVENRVAIARSVNTGDSGFIDSCGRIVKLVRDRAGNAIGAVGTDSWVVQIDARETFFSRIGDLFPIICGMVGALLVGWTLVRPRRPA